MKTRKPEWAVCLGRDKKTQRRVLQLSITEPRRYPFGRGLDPGIQNSARTKVSKKDALKLARILLDFALDQS